MPSQSEINSQDRYGGSTSKAQKMKQYREAWEAAIEEYNNYGRAALGTKGKIDKAQANLMYGFKAGYTCSSGPRFCAS